MYKLKTLFMKKQIAKKQKSKPFDYEAAESFTLAEDEDPRVNNSYYFSAHGEKESLYCRLGLRSDRAEVWFYYSNGDDRLVAKTNIYKSNPPLRVKKTESGWDVFYDGELTDEHRNSASASFTGHFSSDQAAVDFFSHMPPVCTARAMAAEKWSKEFFAEVQKNNQVHYEQTGRLVGLLKIAGAEYKIDLPCVRDHSYGAREWDYMNNHVWIMGVGEHSQINFSMVSYPSLTLLEVGNLTVDGKMKFMTECNYRRELVMGGFPESLTLNLKMDDGTRLNVVVTKEDEERYSFDGGAYNFSEGIATIKVNGEKLRGIFELGYNRNIRRIFNGKEIRKIKV
ncbi:MAG: hypothetical protein E7350_03425 [Clostridiales bacterium]|nr:hypothetical protein [Clostridiales bacterium]